MSTLISKNKIIKSNKTIKKNNKKTIKKNISKFNSFVKNGGNNSSNNKSYFWKYLKKIDKNKKAIYFLDNVKVINPKIIDRLNKIYIPPAYENVIIAKSPNFKIQAIGTDSKGRKQYIYHPSFTQQQIEKKYNDILHLGNKILEIEKHNTNLVKQICNKKYNQLNLPKDYYPIITMLLLKYHFRIGSHKYEKDNNSFGIVTLLKDHIILLDNTSKFSIEFIGKKGVNNKIIDNNKSVYDLMKMLKYQNNNDSHIFCYTKNNKKKMIYPEDIKNYLNVKYNTNITPKMFRTWYGNYYLLSYLKNIRNDKNFNISDKMKKKDIKSLIKNSSIYVSSKLNNTPTISKKSYINPKILNLLLENPKKFINNIPHKKDKIHIYLQKII